MPTRDNGDTPFIARDATYHRAPEGLEARVRGAVARAASAERTPRRWQLFAFAASMAALSSEPSGEAPAFHAGQAGSTPAGHSRG